MSIDKPFSYGGKNCLAEMARTDILFFLDSDMLLTPALLQRAVEVVQSGKAFFPLYQRFHGPNTDKKYWGAGWGCAAVHRSHWKENNWIDRGDWGCAADNIFAAWFKRRDLIVREKVQNYYHQWHPLSASKLGQCSAEVKE